MPAAVIAAAVRTPIGKRNGALAEQHAADLSALVLNKSAMLQAIGRDARGRTVATLAVDGISVGRSMVEEGHAWSVRTRDDKGPFVKQERMAKALGRGLHASPGAVMPRDWRRTKGACPA